MSNCNISDLHSYVEIIAYLVLLIWSCRWPYIYIYIYTHISSIKYTVSICALDYCSIWFWRFVFASHATLRFCWVGAMKWCRTLSKIAGFISIYYMNRYIVALGKRLRIRFVCNYLLVLGMKDLKGMLVVGHRVWQSSLSFFVTYVARHLLWRIRS